MEHIPHDSSSEEFFSENGLTPIPRRIHWAATQDAIEGGYSEADMISVKNFLNTLAEVALAVASRNVRNRDDQP